MTSQMKRMGLIVLAVVLAVGLSLLGAGLSGILFRSGEAVQTSTGGTEASQVVTTEGGEIAIFAGPAAVATEDLALISQGEPAAALSESLVTDRAMELYEGEVFFVGTAVTTVTTSESVPRPEALDLIAYGNEPVVAPLALMEIVIPDQSIDVLPALTLPDMDLIADSVGIVGSGQAAMEIVVPEEMSGVSNMESVPITIDLSGLSMKDYAD